MRRFRPPPKIENSGSNIGPIIVVFFALCVCCIFLAVSAAIAIYYYYKPEKKEEAPFDKSLLEYRDSQGSHIIKTLPATIKDAYYLNMPVEEGSRYTFMGKRCLDGICDDVKLKSVAAINLYYDDGNLLEGTLDYKKETGTSLILKDGKDANKDKDANKK